MRTKYADIGVYALIVAMGVIVLVQNASLPEAFGGDVGPAFFPSSLAWIMIGMCGLGIVRCVTGENRELLDFPGLKKIIVTIVAVASYFIIWQSFGQFYLLTTLLLSGLLVFYSSDEKLTRKVVVASIAGSVGFVALIYVFFTFVLYTKF